MLLRLRSPICAKGTLRKWRRQTTNGEWARVETQARGAARVGAETGSRRAEEDFPSVARRDQRRSVREPPPASASRGLAHYREARQVRGRAQARRRPSNKMQSIKVSSSRSNTETPSLVVMPVQSTVFTRSEALLHFTASSRNAVPLAERGLMTTGSWLLIRERRRLADGVLRGSPRSAPAAAPACPRS